MKKTVGTVLMVSALFTASAAMAEVTSSSLTTKGYVDGGLQYLNNKITPLQTAVNGDGTNANPGLLNRVTALENASSPAAVSQLQTDVANLQATVNGTENTDGLVDRVTDLETAVDGKQATIDANNKLSADLIEDGTNNKVLTAADKTKLNNLTEYVDGDGIVFTAGTGNNAGKTVISVDMVSDWATDKPNWAN